MNSPRHDIAVILPSQEYFTSAAASAVGLFVRDTTRGSAYAENIVVYGRNDTRSRRFSDIRYHGIEPSMSFLYGKAGGYARAVVDALHAQRPRMIEVHNRVTTFRRIARNFPNIPIVLYLHNDPMEMKGLNTPRDRWRILSRADAIYCSSDYIRRRFLTGLEAGRSEHVHVVHNFAATKPRRKKDPLIFYVGHLSPDKGVAELAEAAQMLLPHFPQWRIVFAGAARPGKNDTAYARRVYRMLQPLGKQAVFLGHQPNEKIMTLYARSAIAVMPSIAPEPSARAAIEAVTAGCALVTSGHGALAEIAGEAAPLVSPVTAKGLALSLQGLMEDPEGLHGIQNLCYEHSRQFSLESGLPYLDDLRQALFIRAYGG